MPADVSISSRSAVRHAPAVYHGRSRSSRRSKPLHTRAAVVGIDLGTSNSSVAVIQHGVPVVVPSTQGSTSTPSIVRFREVGAACVIAGVGHTA